MGEVKNGRHISYPAATKISVMGVSGRNFITTYIQNIRGG
jgi:putative lipoic acid-binding regulatory protein